MSEPAFRAFTAADTGAVTAMMRELGGTDGIPFDETRARKALAILAHGSSKELAPGSLWLIDSTDGCAGYMVVTFAFSCEFGGWYGFIDELFLREPYRNRGWGTRAIQLAAAICRDRGMSVLLLEAALVNDGAIRLYRRLGFDEHRRRLMRLSLA